MTDTFFNSFEDESKMKALGSMAVILAAFAAVFTSLAAWVTHIVVCIKTASWILLVVGIVAPPIGWVHGIGYWFGAF